MERADKKSIYGLINGDLPFTHSDEEQYSEKLKFIIDKVLHMVSIEESLGNLTGYINRISLKFNEVINKIEVDFIRTYSFSGYGFVFREFIALIFSALYRIDTGIVVDAITNSIVKDEKWYIFIPISNTESKIELMYLFRKIDVAIMEAEENENKNFLHNLATQTLTELDIALEDMKIPSDFNSEVFLTVLIQEIVSVLK